MKAVTVALKEITETKRLLELLITSSESFDYQTAKLALAELEQKIGRLGAMQMELEQTIPPPANVHRVHFESGGLRPSG